METCIYIYIYVYIYIFRGLEQMEAQRLWERVGSVSSSTCQGGVRRSASDLGPAIEGVEPDLY